ncbi:hypothetical protein GCM10011415_05440 [Salipiger pallidus]|uniref:GS catalytic domain-containing protein n=1 Tax=Salipiger pallidus TaxID=1775170 RepID=A0A8J3EF02_9RHOB|nr:glutamine synthetase [Salipiger pallidus]GGG62126.1 hypothetical protein GCM10011415_05440 [Salipiger pallidus]
MGSVAKKGFQLVSGATVNLFTNRAGDYLGYGPEAAELVGIPEPEPKTFMQLPQAPELGRLYCTLFRNREKKVDPGAFLTADCRGSLRRMHKALQEKHGLHLRMGTKPEMMWLKNDENGKPTDGMSKPYCYHFDQLESLMGSALLAAMDEGLDNSLDPGSPEERNICDAMAQGKTVKKLPMSLGEALVHLENDEVVQRGLPGEMFRLYHEYKTDQWAPFLSTVIDWEKDTCMECLP